MILYLDTSALVKLYVEEAHTDDVRGWVDEAEIVATCRVAYPEAVSALNRRMRAGDTSESRVRNRRPGVAERLGSARGRRFR